MGTPDSAPNVDRHLAELGPLRGIDEPRSEELERLKDLWFLCPLSTGMRY